jgi:hypothetical protein
MLIAPDPPCTGTHSSINRYTLAPISTGKMSRPHQWVIMAFDSPHSPNPG